MAINEVTAGLAGDIINGKPIEVGLGANLIFSSVGEAMEAASKAAVLAADSAITAGGPDGDADWMTCYLQAYDHTIARTIQLIDAGKQRK